MYRVYFEGYLEWHFDTKQEAEEAENSLEQTARYLGMEVTELSMDCDGCEDL